MISFDPVQAAIAILAGLAYAHHRREKGATVQDFDKARIRRIAEDRTFTIGGELFTRVASVRPEVLLEWSSINDDTPPHETLRIYDEVILELVSDADAAERWKRLRAIDGDEALTIFDIQDVISWLVEGLGARPLEPSSGSSDGPPTPTGTTESTPASSSPDIPALTPST